MNLYAVFFRIPSNNSFCIEHAYALPGENIHKTMSEHYSYLVVDHVQDIGYISGGSSLVELIKQNFLYQEDGYLSIVAEQVTSDQYATRLNASPGYVPKIQAQPRTRRLELPT